MNLLSEFINFFFPMRQKPTVNHNHNRNVRYRQTIEAARLSRLERVKNEPIKQSALPALPINKPKVAIAVPNKPKVKKYVIRTELDFMIHYKQKLLEEGKTFETSEKGNSMIPLIKSGQKHVLAPVEIKEVKVGDIVFARVGRSYYTHLVTAIDAKKGVQISNNHGYINGWTKNVYGKVINIL